MPKLPVTTQALLRAVRAYSPITTDQRHTMERSLRSISSTTRFGPKEAQKIADAFRPPLVQVGRAAVAGFVEYGYWLQRLHDRCPHGLWLSLFTGAGSRDGIVRPIPMSRQQAQALLRIAKHPLLSNPDVIDQLPPHWRTLDTLTRVPDAVLDEAVTRGRIHVKMERAEAEALIPRAGARAGFTPHAALPAPVRPPSAVRDALVADVLGPAARDDEGEDEVVDDQVAELRMDAVGNRPHLSVLLVRLAAVVRERLAALTAEEATRFLDQLEALVHELRQVTARGGRP